MSATPFSKTFVAGWGDMDFNAHMRNTAYLDKAADLRMMYFAAHGFPMSEFARLRLGPVVTRDELEYVREIHLLQELTVTLTLVALAADGGRMIMRNEFFRDGTLAARVTSTVVWFDLAQRRPTCPPEALLAVIRGIEPSADFAVLPAAATAKPKETTP